MDGTSGDVFAASQSLPIVTTQKRKVLLISHIQSGKENLLVVSTHLKNMLVKLEIFPK